MGRKVDVDDLVGSTQIAERLGFTRVQSVHYCYRTDPAFPRPVFDEGRYGAKVWNWPDVEAWARTSGRLPVPARRRV
jgi:hypothetical protein